MCRDLLALASLALLVGCVFAPRVSAADETLQQRRVRLEQLSDAEKMRLLQKKRRFDELSPEEQDRLRDLHQALSADPQSERLRGVLERYSEWLKTLTSVERAELAKLPAEQRVTHVKDLIEAQDAKRFRMMFKGQLSPGDSGAIRKWVDDFVAGHAADILAALPDDNPRLAELKSAYDPEKHGQFLRFLVFRSDVPGIPKPDKQDEAGLRKLLSQEARGFLDKAPSDDDRSRIIQHWTGAAFAPRLPPISPEEMEQFVGSLTDGERARLESLPRDRMYRDLRMMYFQKKWGEYGKRKPSGGRRGPGPRGGFEGGPGSGGGRGNWGRPERSAPGGGDGGQDEAKTRKPADPGPSDDRHLPRA